MHDITYEIDGDYVTAKPTFTPYLSRRVEIYNRPEIGQRYRVVCFCDYDNSELVEVTADNLAKITFRMNDRLNDIAEYILVED